MLETDALTSPEFDQLLLDLQGFGITSNEDIITLNVRGRKLTMQIANISPDMEIFAMARAEGLKGYAWIQRMRCEIMAQATVRLNGVEIATVPYATDPKDGSDRPVRLILTDMYAGWGQEAVLILWKIYMNHCQKLEDELLDQLPDNLIMTEVEKRFMDRIGEELAQIGALAVTETALAATSGSTGEEVAPPKE